MLAHLYSRRMPLKAMATAVLQHIVSVPQRNYVPNGVRPLSVGLAPRAYAYVPAMCWADISKCSLHVHYHGCGGAVGSDTSSLLWVELPYWAESNGIVVLYPQAVAAPGNSNACWDWWG